MPGFYRAPDQYLVKAGVGATLWPPWIPTGKFTEHMLPMGWELTVNVDGPVLMESMVVILHPRGFFIIRPVRFVESAVLTELHSPGSA